jgi:hypothetical protein
MPSLIVWLHPQHQHSEDVAALAKDVVGIVWGSGVWWVQPELGMAVLAAQYWQQQSQPGAGQHL